MKIENGLAPVRRALISVSDKTGIIDFARKLSSFGIEIFSTGGTCRVLRDAEIKVIDIADYTGFPEMMAGRIKTLHPKIHGGILGRRSNDDDVMAAHKIQPIDLVVVNLYPFEETVAAANCTFDDAVENIDIGGPTMVRAAAKNHCDVTVIVLAEDYERILRELSEHNVHTTQATRFDLAVRAFEHTAHYDGMVASYLGRFTDEGSEDFPRTLNLQFYKKQDMRYGENPHQKAAFYRETRIPEASISSAEQLLGKSLSYNNVSDTDAAFECVKGFTKPACVIVKHANPCGVAVNDDINTAYQLAFQTDSESAFGGIIAFNRMLDADTAATIIAKQFVEVIIAPEVSPEACSLIAEKKSVRLLRTGDWSAPRNDWDVKRVNGGLLIQDRDNEIVKREKVTVVSRRHPTETEWVDLMFAWHVAKFVKSNAIVFASQQRTVGVGAGQMSRVNSTRIAATKAAQAGLSVNGAVMASDAFFPFRDAIDTAGKQGVVAVIHPGGSIRDREVIAAADEADIAMVFTQIRHFRH